MDKYQFKLIQGDFSPQDAKTVLMSVINSKINFHNLNAFSEFVKNNEDLISESIENDDDEVENCHSVTNDLNSYLIDKINDNKEELKHENCKNQDWILIDKSGICSYNKEYLDDNNLIIKSCFYSIILTNSDNFDSSYTISSQKYELKDILFFIY